eukprot:9518828-Alexandrium_andersonii.AAC.1
MSASLVGSEMCIRDRPWSLRAATLLETSGVNGSVSERPCERTCEGSLRAVSYTHLTLPTICSV